MEKLKLEEQNGETKQQKYEPPKAAFVSTTRDVKMSGCAKNPGNVFCRGCK